MFATNKAAMMICVSLANWDPVCVCVCDTSVLSICSYALVCDTTPPSGVIVHTIWRSHCLTFNIHLEETKFTRCASWGMVLLL